MRPEDPYWAIGNLVTIYGPRSRVICLVQDMSMVNDVWRQDEDNDARANIEMLGEIVDEAPGKPQFRRGIMNYPPLGAAVHRIRSEDLMAMYDLKERKPSTVGSLVMDERIQATINIEGMLKKHFAVVGTTGVGKSSSVSILLRKSVEDRERLRVIILDPHNEYSSVFRDIAVTVDARNFELPFWLFQFEEFLEVVYRGTPAPLEESDFLREAIADAREGFSGAERGGGLAKWNNRSEEGGADAPRPYRLADVLAQIDVEIGRLEPRYPRPALRNLKHRLEALSNDQNFRFMFGKAAVDARMDFVTRSLFRLHDTGKPVTILRMAGIPADVVNASVSVLSRLAFDLCVLHRGKQEVLVVCEEAHRYVPADLSLGFNPTRRSIARIAKEGRKYGCYLGIVTQRPAELDPTILSQCSTIFAMRLSNASDQQIMRSAIPDNAAGALEFISALNNREAIAFGEAVATAMRMVFALQEDALLPRMSTEWDENAAQDDLGDGRLRMADGAAPSDPKPAAKPDPMSRFHEPIAAPAFGGWRAERRAGDAPIQPTREWPSSERMRR